MKWVKVFEDIEAAKDRIQEHRSVLVTVGTRKVCLSRFNDQFYAISDECPHNSESLSKGKINHLGEVICPWHNYRFRIIDGQSVQPGCGDAATFAVRSNKEGLYLGLPE